MTEVRKQPELDARSLEAAARALMIAYYKVNEGYFKDATDEDGNPIQIVPWENIDAGSREEYIGQARAAILAFLEAERVRKQAGDVS